MVRSRDRSMVNGGIVSVKERSASHSWWPTRQTIAIKTILTNQTFSSRYSRSHGLITSMKVSNSARLIAA